MPFPSAKSAAERILSRPPAAWLGRRHTRTRRLVLAYHNVVPDGTPQLGDASLHLPLRRFTRQMDHLRSVAQVVPLGRLLEPDDPTSGSRAPLVAVTFDDAYRGAVRFGAEVLAERNMPATIFVPPGLLGGGAFWWDLLRWPANARATRRIRDHALGALQGRRDRVLSWAREEGIGTRSPPAVFAPASEAEVISAAALPGMFLGSHSWSHPSLPTLEPQELRRELTRPRDWFKGRTNRFLPWLSYPYGHHCDRVRTEAAAAGYRGGLQVEGGWFSTAEEDRFAVPRLNVPANLSTDGFRARVAGFLAS